MTAEAWNVFLDATILVLMVGYGFWLKHITTQQDRLKNDTVESLNAVIASKEAEIARLKGEIAPEVAKSYKAMRDHAEEMTRRANELEQDSQRLKAELGEKDGLLSSNYLLGNVAGLLTATEMMQPLLLDPEPNISGVFSRLLDLARARNDHGREQIKKRTRPA